MLKIPDCTYLFLMRLNQNMFCFCCDVLFEGFLHQKYCLLSRNPYIQMLSSKKRFFSSASLSENSNMFIQEVKTINQNNYYVFEIL